MYINLIIIIKKLYHILLDGYFIDFDYLVHLKIIILTIFYTNT